MKKDRDKWSKARFIQRKKLKRNWRNGKIIPTERTIDDLTNIAEISSRYSEKYASSIISKLFSKVDILKTMPKIGRLVPEQNNERVKELIEGNYRIIYEKNRNDRVEVLLVHHSSRPIGNL